MRDIHRWTTRAAGVALILAAGACAREHATPAAEPQRQATRGAPSGARAQAPAGTDFSATMNERITSSTATPGMTFTATIQKPIVSSDGNMLVKQGATLNGRVVDVGRGETHDMKLAFDSIETVDGTAPVSARIVEADEHGLTVGRFDYDPDVVGYDTVLLPGTLAPGVGGGPVPPSEDVTNEIVLPTGGELRFVLTRPLWGSQGMRVRSGG